jgi:hypothetical protein
LGDQEYAVVQQQRKKHNAARRHVEIFFKVNLLSSAEMAAG